jgi:putative transposase
MPRKKLIRTNEYYYHITTRSNHKHWFQLELDQVWEISIRAFKKAMQNCPAEVSQYVLMNNHYHMLIRTPNCDIDRFMFWFNKTFSDELRVRAKMINRMFGSNYNWSLIANNFHLFNIVRYIYQNPLRAGIIANSESYPYSTLFYHHNKIELGFPTFPFHQLESDLSFLNEQPDDKVNISYKKGLMKTQFSPVISRKPKRRASQR